MKKNNRKKLNNKGFTLIELLAVVVILAVVMGIAMNSVLSAMNKSRGGSLQDSAMVIANSFTQKYTESLVGGTPSDIYSDVTDADGYDFLSSATYTLTKNLADTFNITSSGYALSDNVTPITNADAQTVSTVSFNASTGKFIVCMVANTNGSYFVDAYKLASDKVVADVVTKTDSAGNLKLTFASGQVVACSDGNKSW